jgi:hypothetical protein
VNQKSGFEKEGVMSNDDEVRNRLMGELINARTSAERAQAKYNNLMERSYLHPESAEKNIEEYRGENGDKGLHKKLSETVREPAFGRRPGSIASRDGYTEGASERRKESLVARQYLPDAVAEKNKAMERLKYAERAVESMEHPSPSEPTPSKTPEARKPAEAKGSFKERLANQSLTSPKDRDALERLKGEREKDKDIER